MSVITIQSLLRWLTIQIFITKLVYFTMLVKLVTLCVCATSEQNGDGSSREGTSEIWVKA